MKLLIIIDPIESLNPKKDSSIALFRAAFSQDLDVFYTTVDKLWVQDGIPYGEVYSVSVTHHDEKWYQVESQQKVALNELDIIIMRKDPPFDMNYIYTTYLLDLCEQQGVLIANKPQSLRDCNEKYTTSFFKDVCPPTLISQDVDLLKSFYQTHQDVIYKPLEGMGGHNIFHVSQNEKNLNVILEVLTNDGKTPIMAQRYIPAIKESGDKRVLIIHGKTIPFALARIPQGDDIRGNLARGAKAQVTPLTEKEIKRCDTIASALKAKGLFLVGLDLIGDYITEINVTSPTGIRELERETQLDISGQLIKGLIELRA